MLSSERNKNYKNCIDLLKEKQRKQVREDFEKYWLKKYWFKKYWLKKYWLKKYYLKKIDR